MLLIKPYGVELLFQDKSKIEKQIWGSWGEIYWFSHFEIAWRQRYVLYHQINEIIVTFVSTTLQMDYMKLSDEYHRIWYYKAVCPWVGVVVTYRCILLLSMGVWLHAKIWNSTLWSIVARWQSQKSIFVFMCVWNQT